MKNIPVPKKCYKHKDISKPFIL